MDLVLEVVWRLVQRYLEQKGPVAVDSPFNEPNWDNIGLELHLELAEVKDPEKSVQIIPFHCSAHGVTDQPVKSTSKNSDISRLTNLFRYYVFALRLYNTVLYSYGDL